MTLRRGLPDERPDEPNPGRRLRAGVRAVWAWIRKVLDAWDFLEISFLAVLLLVAIGVALLSPNC